MIGPADVRPDTLLFLRQAGLRDDLIAAAAAAGHPGWLDPGIALFHDIGDRLGSTDLVPCGPFERLVLVERALHVSGDFFSSLRRADAFVDAADRLFGEFLAEGIRPVDLEGAFQRAAPRDGFQRDRDRALLHAFRTYASALEQAGRRDGRDDVADCAAAIMADPEACRAALGERNAIRVVGLHDLGGGWPLLLAALETVAGLETVEVEGRAAAELDVGSVTESSGGSERGSPRISVFSAYGPDREVEEVAVRVRALLDSGVAPDRVCVVARGGRPHTELAVRALERLAVPVTARRRRRLEQIPVVRAVLSLYAAAADGWTRHALAELAEQPYIGSDLDAVVLNHIGYQRRVQGLSAWTSALRRLQERAERTEAEAESGDDPSAGGERRASVPPAAWVREAVEGFRAFAERAAELERPRPRGEWLDGLADALAEDHWGMAERVYRVPVGHEELARWDIAGWEGLRRVVDELRAGEAAWGGAEEPLDAAAFHRFLRSMLRGDAAIRTPVRTGVRVLEAPAAAYRRFDHVFAVGLEGGAWPLSPPASPLLEEGDRERLREEGLPVRTRADWDRREEALYAVIAEGARETLTLSWSRVDDRGEPTVPSVFVEDVAAPDESPGAAVPSAPPVAVCHLPTHRVLTPGVPLVADVAAALQAKHAAGIERERASGRPGPWNGAVEDAEMRAWLAGRYDANYVWSATSLEGVAKCPWAWFGGRLLRLEKREDPDADLDPIARGNLYHDALRRFYQAAGERVAGPVRLTEDDLDWARDLAAEATRAALAEAAPRDAAALRAVPAPMRDVKAAELERTVIRFLEWEAQLAAQGETPRFRSKYPQLRTGVVDHELTFDALEIPIGEEVLRLRGTIDRVEVGVDPRVPDADRYAAAVDYKSTQYSMPAAGKSSGWDDGVVQQLPLYAAALSRLDPDREVARLEYRAVRTRTVGHALPLVAVAKGDAGPERDADAAARQEAALRAALSSARRVREGEFPANPAPSCGCPPYCHGWDICRVPGGPRR